MSDTSDTLSQNTQAAQAAYQASDLDGAIRLAELACSRNAKDADAWAICGLVEAQRQDFSAAASHLTKAVELGCRMPTVPAALGMCLARTQGPENAVGQLRQLLASHPKNTGLRLEIAYIYYSKEQFTEELDLCTDGIEAGDEDGQLLLIYGRSLLSNDRPEEGVKALKEAVAKAPENPEAHFLLGTAYRSLGLGAQARAAHLGAMEQVPFFAKSFYAYLRSGPVTEEDALVQCFAEIEPYLAQANPEEASFLHYGLGTAFEALGEYDKAFLHYERGGRMRSRSQRYDRRSVERKFEVIKKAFTPESMKSLAHLGNDTERPVFVIGMPRSGSSLVEQILSAHGKVEGLGELLDLDRMVHPHLETLTAATLGEMPLRDMADQYLEKITNRASQSDTRLVDKGLHNFMAVGFIHIMFPKAIILHCERDPLDTCFSCFALRFASGLEWSNRLSSVGHYYNAYRSMMDHWEQVLPGQVTRVSYEELASDFEPQVRQLLGACTLEWDPACLDFHKSDNAVRTASSAQVREPINTSSIGRWKRFEKHLGKLRKAIGQQN